MIDYGYSNSLLFKIAKKYHDLIYSYRCNYAKYSYCCWKKTPQIKKHENLLSEAQLVRELHVDKTYRRGFRIEYHERTRVRDGLPIEKPVLHGSKKMLKKIQDFVKPDLEWQREKIQPQWAERRARRAAFMNHYFNQRLRRVKLEHFRKWFNSHSSFKNCKTENERKWRARHLLKPYMTRWLKHVRKVVKERECKRLENDRMIMPLEDERSKLMNAFYEKEQYKNRLQMHECKLDEYAHAKTVVRRFFRSHTLNLTKNKERGGLIRLNQFRQWVRGRKKRMIRIKIEKLRNKESELKFQLGIAIIRESKAKERINRFIRFVITTYQRRKYFLRLAK